jgi:polyhydroxyalkanoate synthase
MNDQPGAQERSPDGAEMAREMADIARRTQRLVADFVARQSALGPIGNVDPLNISSAFLEMTRQMMMNPAALVEAQFALWQDHIKLWRSTSQRMLGQGAESAIEPDQGDRRFSHPDWEEIEIFNFMKQSYLLTARWVQSLVGNVEGLDEKSARKVAFYTRQFVDALSPSNFVLTNPEVLRTTIETHGENLVRGTKNLLDDLERGRGMLSIRMTDDTSFEVGGNVANTPGKIIYQNELMQLIQYAPLTETVYTRPLLIIPPWINKYYVLDLGAEKSFVRWAAERGHTVFVISWVNPDETLAEKTFDDYLLEGPIAAMDAIERAIGATEFNLIGYCIGGTLLACLLAYMTAKGDRRVKSATYLAALVDFSDAGELGVFVDEEQLAEVERRMGERGFLEGHEMATTFNLLRANDLIWSFVVNNYLLGKDPFPFDLLYWNADSTRMPAAMHAFYLRNMYLENTLVRPGALEIAGTTIDMHDVTVPSFWLATREDHIAPWKSVYASMRLFSGPMRFALASSGHIAGVVNPPDKRKYGYASNALAPKNADAWLKGASERSGSWWPEWANWVRRRAGKRNRPAPVPGAGGLPAIEDAPGAYIKVKSN